jgi:hypothetical protein
VDRCTFTSPRPAMPAGGRWPAAQQGCS